MLHETIKKMWFICWNYYSNQILWQVSPWFHLTAALMWKVCQCDLWRCISSASSLKLGDQDNIPVWEQLSRSVLWFHTVHEWKQWFAQVSVPTGRFYLVHFTFQKGNFLVNQIPKALVCCVGFQNNVILEVQNLQFPFFCPCLNEPPNGCSCFCNLYLASKRIYKKKLSLLKWWWTAEISFQTLPEVSKGGKQMVTDSNHSHHFLHTWEVYETFFIHDIFLALNDFTEPIIWAICFSFPWNSRYKLFNFSVTSIRKAMSTNQQFT